MLCRVKFISLMTFSYIFILALSLEAAVVVYDLKNGRSDSIVVLETDGHGQVDYYTRKYGVSLQSVDGDIFRSFFGAWNSGPIDLCKRIIVRDDKIITSFGNNCEGYAGLWKIYHEDVFSQAVCQNSAGRVIYRSLMDKGLAVHHPIWIVGLASEMNLAKKNYFCLVNGRGEMTPALLTKNSLDKKKDSFTLSSQGRHLARIIYNRNGLAIEIKFSDNSKMHLRMLEKDAGKLGHQQKFLSPDDLSRYLDPRDERIALGTTRFLQNDNVIYRELTLKYDVSNDLRQLIKPRLLAMSSPTGYKNIDFEMEGGMVKARIKRNCYLSYSNQNQLIKDSKQEIENDLKQKLGDNLYQINLNGSIFWELENDTLKARYEYYYEKKKKVERSFDLSRTIQEKFIAKYGRAKWRQKDYMSVNFNDSQANYTCYETIFFIFHKKLGKVAIEFEPYGRQLANEFKIISRIKPTANDQGRLVFSFMVPDRSNGKAQVSFELAEGYRNKFGLTPKRFILEKKWNSARIYGEIDYGWDLSSILSDLLKTVSFSPEETSLGYLENSLYRDGQSWYIEKKCRLEKNINEETVTKVLRRKFESVAVADIDISYINEQKMECKFFGGKINR